MKNLLLESIDNESRKAAVNFLKNNFKRCFTLDKQDLTDDEKLKVCQDYVKSAEITYCMPWDAGECNWAKALIMAVVRILKTECNDGTSRPTNTRMIERLKKVIFAATMYRQKQVWDGVPKENIMSKDADGMNFYKLSDLVMPHYNELMDIYLNGYGDVWPGKQGQADIAARKRAEKDAANKRRYDELVAKKEAGEQLTAEEQAFVDRIKAKLAQQNAPVQAQDAVQQNAEEAEQDDEDQDDPWAENSGFTNDHPRPYMKGRFRIGNKGYWAVRIDTFEQSKTWWWWTYPNCPYPTEINHTWCITNPNSRNFYNYGIGTSVTAYYVFKEGFEKLQRPHVSATAPYDEWGKSLMCIMINRAFNAQSSNVHVCASRYNQAQPNNRPGYADGYGNGFFGARVDKLCELFGCTKQDIYDKFVYKLANAAQQDVSAPNDKETKKILNGLNACNNMEVSAEVLGPFDNKVECGKRLEAKGFYAYYYKGNIVTPWVKQFNYRITKNNLYLHYIVNNKAYITYMDGKPVFNDALDTRWEFDIYNDDTIMVLKHTSGKFLVYNLKTKSWVTDRPVEGIIHSCRYPYIGLTNGKLYQYLPAKNKLIDATEKLRGIGENPGRNLYGFSVTKNFVTHRNKVYLIKTGEIIDFPSITDTRDDCLYSNYTNKILKSDGTIIDLNPFKQKLTEEGYTVQDNYRCPPFVPGKPYFLYIATTREYKKVKISVIYFDGTNTDLEIDIPQGYRYSLEQAPRIYELKTNTTSKIMVIDKDGKPKVNDLEYDVTARFNRSGHCYSSVKINRHRAMLYDENCNLVFTVPNEYEMRTKILDIDVSKSGNLLKVKTNKGYALGWTNTNTSIAIGHTDFIPIGNDYVFIKKDGEGKVYDDRGKLILSGNFNLNAGFTDDGIASVISNDNEKKITYFNLDNEYSDSLEELVESIKVKKKTRVDYILEAAAYFC